MKKVFILSFAVLAGILSGRSQSIESVKTLAMLPGQLEKAKADFDKIANNPKVSGKAEAYVLKTAIYAALAMADNNRNTPNGIALAQEADAAFEKYKLMEPDTKKMSEEALYQNGPINIYSFYYNQGLADYNNKKWQEAVPMLQKAIDYSDFLITKSLLNSPLDTNLLILTGVVAERAKDNKLAAMAYNRLVNASVKGPDFEGVYQYLVRYYYAQKDLAQFESIKSKGASLYPESEFFQLDEMDFAVGMAESVADKLNALNEFIAKDPENYKAHEFRWTYLYDTITNIQDGDEVPADMQKWEADFFVSIKKCAQLKPQDVKNPQFLGNYYVIKKEAANQARIQFAEELQRKTKPGTKASPADIAKRDQLDKEYQQSLEMILDPYLQAAKLFAAMPQLGPREKQQYKNIAGYLSEIYESKKKRSSKDPAAAAKWAAEEKKWNDVYDSIK